MYVLSSAPPGSAWTFGGSILTFAFPMILVIVVTAALYVVYTKPEVVPGHRIRPPERPVSYTAVPGPPPAPGSGPGQAAPTESGAAAGTSAEAAAGTSAEAAAGTAEAAAGTSADEAAGTGDAE